MTNQLHGRDEKPISSNPSIDELLGSVGFIERKGNVGVLLIHGLTGTPTEMKQFGKLIARKGFTVACPELAGHCATIEALSATKWHDWYISIEKAFDALKQECDHVFVAGLSMGALIALLLAAKRGNQVAGVILLSTTFFYDGWNVPKFKQTFLLPLVLYTPLKYFFHWEETSPYGIKDERTRALVHAILENRDNQAADKIGYFKTPATVILESVRMIDAAKKVLKNVIVPTLIVHATEDDMASIRNAHYTQANISSKTVETFFVDDTYHVLTLDKRKDDVAKRAAQFCKEQAHILTSNNKVSLAA
ncbi:alpha/beta hydrolase [Methylotenera versatilis]|uniref:Alpha/beta hydrolase fold protein n=1 Tax=Methylotenera versatilis (strain 301) TaxID=666681 RepID=D7DJC6_METV0|nr:alpha/beta fold hydrolase [Methylotenera versatilis]ADI30161.1 alpha/beta hydrolase fold protein [Methylotenera versatilis 301]